MTKRQHYCQHKSFVNTTTTTIIILGGALWLVVAASVGLRQCASNTMMIPSTATTVQAFVMLPPPPFVSNHKNQVVGKTRIGNGNNHAFLLIPRNGICTSNNRASTTALNMGLYDNPLPPPPFSSSGDDDDNNKDGKNKRNNNRKEKEENDDDYDDDGVYETHDEMPLLFTFNKDGTEINNYLPPLKRKLTTGIECYFEPTDALVKLLVDQTGCNPMDAGWALEAHRGNIDEARVSITTVRRMKLNKQMALPNQKEIAEVDWDEELSQLLQQSKNKEEVIRPLGNDDVDERWKQIKDQRRKDDVKDFVKGGEPDEKWLPGKDNPRPVDDEPWFTG